MTLDTWIALTAAAGGVASAGAAYFGLRLVAVQIREGAKQQELFAEQVRENTRQNQRQGIVSILNRNFELVSLGFKYRELLRILADEPSSDAMLERRYLQAWLNQVYLIYLSFKRPDLPEEFKEDKEAFERDVADMMHLKNLRQHWRGHGSLYATSFQTFVNGIISNIEPLLPDAAAQPDSRV